jgi:hypothetical protein
MNDEELYGASEVEQFPLVERIAERPENEESSGNSKIAANPDFAERMKGGIREQSCKDERRKCREERKDLTAK